MKRFFPVRWLGLIAVMGAVGLSPSRSDAPPEAGARAGDERTIESMRFCWCPPGAFLMGSPAGEEGHRPDEVQVAATLSRGFWIGKFEVTQGQWKRWIGAFPTAQPADQGDEFPVVEVSYHDVDAFCRELSNVAHKSGELSADWEFRAPTEAQWEYACRAGTTTATSFGNSLSHRQANFGTKPIGLSTAASASDVPAIGHASRVGSYPPNAWGLCDMHGNVWEWCQDWYHARLAGGVDPDRSDEKGAPNRDGTDSRVRRGGAWIDEGWTCRSAMRLRYEPPRRSDHIGFRVVAVHK